MATDNFWEVTPLESMTEAQWESLCDGCGKCCVTSFIDSEAGVVMQTDLACKLLDLKSCRCSDYPERFAHVPDCAKITPGNVHQLHWLPLSCSYRLVADGKPLPKWHHLISGNEQLVHSTGSSMRGKMISETGFAGDPEERIISWFQLDDTDG